MVTAFVLLMTKTGKERAVVETLKKLSPTKEAYAVYGDYDVMTRVETKDVETLNQFILGSIRSIPDVSMTSTMISL